MPPATNPVKAIQDLLPANRRDIGMFVTGCILALGASSIPGITFEPKALTECRTELAKCEVTSTSLLDGTIDLKTRLDYCRQTTSIGGFAPMPTALPTEEALSE